LEIRITGRRFTVSDKTRAFVNERVEKLLKFWERTLSIHVTLDREGNGHSVEILLSAEHKHDFVARATEERLPTALDQAIGKLERQLAKYKNKIMGRRKGTPVKVLEAEAAAETDDEDMALLEAEFEDDIQPDAEPEKPSDDTSSAAQ